MLKTRVRKMGDTETRPYGLSLAGVVQYVAAQDSGVRPSSYAFAKRVAPFVTFEIRNLLFVFIILLT